MNQIQSQSITIRQASAEDIKTLWGLAAEMKIAKDSGYFERQIDRQGKGELLVLISEWDGEPSGYGVLNWEPKYVPFKKLQIPEIQDLNTAPKRRRQGLATTMITYCENLACEKGYSQMGIGVGLYSSYGSAQTLYTKLGYVPDGVGANYNRVPVAFGEVRPVDDDLCLMMVKNLSIKP